MEAINWIKWSAEFASVIAHAAAVLGGIRTMQYIKAKYADRRIENIQAAWEETGKLLKELQDAGGPPQAYFSHFLDECGYKLREIIRLSGELELDWETDPQTVKKYIWPQKDYATQAKLKIGELRDLQKDIHTSSKEAWLLMANGHPLPREGEVLRPTHAPWPETEDRPDRISRWQTMTTGAHRVYRQAESYFPSPPAPQQTQSPNASSTGLGDGFGPTLPGIRPTGEAAYPYLPRQAPVPGPRSNTMPVPAAYAHFNNVNASPYGHAVPPEPASPYRNADYAASTASAYTTGTAYPPHAYGPQYPPSAPRRR